MPGRYGSNAMQANVIFKELDYKFSFTLAAVKNIYKFGQIFLTR
jgi:hypothetical protein